MSDNPQAAPEKPRRRLSEEHKAKLRAAKLGKPHSADHREAIRLAWQRRKNAVTNGESYRGTAEN